MQICVDSSSKYVDVWLKQDETIDIDIVQKCFAGYDIIVWRSGRGNLSELTAELLKINK